MQMSLYDELSDYLGGFVKNKPSFHFSNMSHKYWPKFQQLINQYIGI